jgi:glycosyltransferase involved in cell wall biosynthesis
MRALSQIPGIKVVVVESCDRDDHGWVRSGESDLDVVTLNATNLSGAIGPIGVALRRVLDDRRSNVLVATGYADPISLQAMVEYRASHSDSLLLLWSESTAQDNRRRWLREKFKGLLLSVFDGALVAGKPHARYLTQLGMPISRIGIVGNCVDNLHFSVGVEAALHVKPRISLPANYFLYVGRMIPVKNLTTLVDAYACYREMAETGAWDLVLVGAGPEEMSIRNRVGHSNLAGVHFAGLRQIDELPEYYGRAKCFVLPSLSEPWGLVVNEAMSCGLPILLSSRAGCAADLVRDGVNGFIFDPRKPAELAQLMLRMSGGTVPLKDFGAAGRQIIAEYTPAHFAERAASHIENLYAARIASGTALWGREFFTRASAVLSSSATRIMRY